MIKNGGHNAAAKSWEYAKLGSSLTSLWPSPPTEEEEEDADDDADKSSALSFPRRKDVAESMAESLTEWKAPCREEEEAGGLRRTTFSEEVADIICNIDLWKGGIKERKEGLNKGK